MLESKERVSVLRMRDLTAKTGLGRSTLYLLMQRGQFPPGFLLTPGGRARGWLARDVERFLARRAASCVDCSEHGGHPANAEESLQ